MHKFCLSMLFFFLLPFLFSQENYEKDEWTVVQKKSFEHIFCCELENEEQYENIDECISEEQHISPSHPSYLSRMYFEGLFNFNSRIAMRKDVTFQGDRSKNYNLNWQGFFNSYLASSYYEFFASFKGNNKDAITVSTASLRFSPLLMRYPRPNHLAPLLSFYIGSFRTPLSFRHLSNISFLHISPTSNRRSHPSLNNIKFSKAKGRLGVAFEVALPFFNFYFFWKHKVLQNNAKNINNTNSPFVLNRNFASEVGNEFNLYVAYKNDKLMAKKAKLNIAFLSSFIQEKGNALNSKNAKLYTQLYAIDFNFLHPHFFFNSLNGISITPEKTVDAQSLSFREECGFSYKIFSLNAGISYEGARYLSKNTKRDRKTLQINKDTSTNASSDGRSESLGDVFAFYVQEKVKWKIFSASHSYSFVKIKQAKLQHSYGFFYSIGNRLALFKNELFFFRELYTLKFSFSTHPNMHYFRTFSASSNLYFQDKSINLHVIKKYEVNTSFVFDFTDSLSCKIEAAMFQENGGGTIGWKARWKKEVFSLKASLFFLFAQERWKEKGGISFKYSTNKNAIDVLLKMRFEY